MNEKRNLLGTDLRLVSDGEGGADLSVSPSGDLATVSHEDNLGQAIQNRLRTRIGELSELGHETLGSRLYTFVGEPNNAAIRDRIRVVVEQTLRQEPRLREVTRVEVTTNRERRDRLDIEVFVIPIGTQVP